MGMKKVKLATKLYMMIVPMAVLFIVTVILNAVITNQTSRSSKQLYFDELYTADSTLISADRDFYQAYVGMLSVLAYKAYVPQETVDGYVNDYVENMEQARQRVTEAVDLLKADSAAAKFVHDDKNIDQLYAQFIEDLDLCLGYYDIYSGEGDIEKFAIYFDLSRADIEALEDFTEEYALAAETKLQTQIASKVIVIIAIDIIFVIASLVFGVIIIIYLRKGVKSVTDSITDIANKNLSNEVKVIDGEDEIAQLSRAAKNLQNQFLNVMKTLKDSSGTLQESSAFMAQNTKESVESMHNIDSAASELAETATHQAEDVTQIASELQEIDTLSNESVDNTESLANACQEIEGITAQSMDTVKTLTDITDQTLQAFNSIYDAIEGIDKKTKTIGAASDMISDIASQTNLLSLNASIEAARAGEVGRGFAVVADEIRQLAEQSARSVETINSMINELYSSSAEATETSHLVKTYVEKQKKSVEDTKISFEAIVDNVSIVNTGVGKLHKINGELGGRINAISGLVDNLSAASEENAATAQELSASTSTITSGFELLEETGNSVSKSSDNLSEIVSEYKV